MATSTQGDLRLGAITAKVDSRAKNGTQNLFRNISSGTLSRADGFSYEGEWVDGVQWGQGKAVWPDKRVYAARCQL